MCHFQDNTSFHIETDSHTCKQVVVDYPYENKSPYSFVFTMRAISKEIEKDRLAALCDLTALENAAREKKEKEQAALDKDARPHLCLTGDHHLS